MLAGTGGVDGDNLTAWITLAGLVMTLHERQGQGGVTSDARVPAGWGYHSPGQEIWEKDDVWEGR